MPRPLHPIRPVELKISIPEDLAMRIELFLHSDLEGKVPYGAKAAFFSARSREFLDAARLDLAPYFPGLPPNLYVVSGSTETISILRKHFEGAA